MGRRIAYFVVAVALFVFADAKVLAYSTPLELETAISNSCDSIKLNLRQLQRNDASVRVSLGKNYEYMLTRLMSNMNSRLAVNHKDAGRLLSITADFSDNLGYFRKNYIIYDQQVSKLLSIDCTKKPAEFYKELGKARVERDEVRYNYNRLNEIMAEYSEELLAVKEGLR